MYNSRLFTRSLIATTALVAAATTVAEDAHAGAFALREQSAYAQGASFAGNAACGDSIASAFWNAAAITCLPGIQVKGAISAVIGQSDITTLPGSTFFAFGSPGNVAEFGAIPATTTSYQINENWYAGVTINGPYGLATDTNFSHAAQYYAHEGEIFSFNVTPMVGWKPSENFSIGVGVQAMYFDLKKFSAGIPVDPSTLDPSATLNGDDIGFGFVAGIEFKPTPNTSIGIGYRSAVSLNLEGNAVSPVAILPIEADLTLPDTVTASIRHRINDLWTVMGTAEWTNWSRIGTEVVTI